MRFHSLGFLFLAGLFSVTVQANQTCRNNFDESTPTSRFVFNDDGTVIDTETKIIWMRCAMGQEWDGKTCTGEAREYSWDEAMDAVTELNSDTFGEPSSWRLPLVPELASIVERRCFEPRVNLIVFPATPSKAFWTGMQRKGNPEQAYALDFSRGKVTPSNKTYEGPIRLMHDGPKGKWWKRPDVKNKKN